MPGSLEAFSQRIAEKLIRTLKSRSYGVHAGKQCGTKFS